MKVFKSIFAWIARMSKYPDERVEQAAEWDMIPGGTDQ